MTIINGTKLRDLIKLDVKKEVDLIIKKDLPLPCLCVVMVGNDSASSVYVRNKEIACADVGIISRVIHLEDTVPQAELNTLMNDLSNDTEVHGILLQLPLPKTLNSTSAISHIISCKDVDGLTVSNLGKLVSEQRGLFPCTPSGIMEIFKQNKISLIGKNVVIINRSLLVGKPLEQMLMNENATVTVCHSHTQNLKMHTLNADIVITAVGKKNIVTSDMVSDGVIIIDVAIIRDEGKLYGDVDFENVKNKSSFITPVPGGVGPLTIAMLLKNTLKAYEMQSNDTE